MDVHSSDKYRKFPPLVESSIDETDESSTQYDDDDDDDDGGGGSARGPTSTTAPSWSSNVVTMNFEGAFRGCSVSSCGTVGSSCCSSDDAALGQSLLRALVMRHRVRQDGDDCGTELLFGQQAAFRPRSPDPEQYTVVGDRRAFIIYDRTCYDIVAVPPNPEDWQPKQLRHHLDAVRAVAGVGFVVCLFRRLPKVRDREVEACSSVHTVAGDARKTAAASKYARSDAAAADGTLHVDLVAVSWTGFASEDDEHRTHSTTSGPSASLSRRQSLLRRAADLARHLAVAFHCPVLVAGAFHLSADEANAALTPPLKSAAGNESHEHQAGVSAVAEPVSGRRRRDKTPVATLTGADLVASTGSIGTGAAFSLRHHEVDDPSRHLRTSGSEFRFDSASGCGTGSDIRSKSCTAGTVSAAVFGNFSDEGDICPSRKDFEVSRRSRSRSPTGRTESDRHHSHGRRSPQATPSGDCLLRCYGYRTDTARRKLRSSQILICFAEPSLAARRVRPLRCGRLRVEVPIRRATTFTPRKTVDATRGRQRLRQGAELAKIAAHSASETAWREPEDYFYWDALSATVHVKTDVDGVLEASVNRLAEEMKTRSATIKASHDTHPPASIPPSSKQVGRPSSAERQSVNRPTRGFEFTFAKRGSVPPVDSLSQQRSRQRRLQPTMSTTAPVSDDRRTKPASGRSSNDAARVRRDPRGAATVAVGRQRSLKPPLMDSQQCNDMEPASRGRQQSRRCEVCISLDRQRRSKSSDSAMKTAATSASDALDGGNRTRQTTGTSHQRLTNRVDYIRSRSVGALPTRNRLTDDVIDVTSSTMSTAKDGSKVDSDFDQRLSTFRPKLTSQSTSDTNVSAEGQSCRRNTRNNLALLKMMAPDMEYGKRQPVGQQSQQTDQSTNFVRFSAAAVGDNDKQMQSTISCTGLKLIFTDALDQPQPVDVATDSLCDSLTFVPERHRREEGNTDRQMNDVDVAVRQSSCDDSLERVTSQVDDDVAVLRTAAVNSEYRKAMNLDDGSDDDIDNAMTIECFYSRRRLSVIREVSETDSAVM